MNELRKNAVIKFREIFRRVDVQYSLFAKAMGVNFTAICILECLSESDVLITQKELSEKLVIPKQMVNTVIKSLWEQGFVELKETTDRRSKLVILTDTGKEYSAKTIKHLQNVDYTAWGCFTDEEIKTLIGLIEKYEGSFKDAVNGFIESETEI
ncbi:MAG: MarR family winged helix-turn-helix transcriptional regulator [Defluviitaleaceae bacterium]|nr:MarR family winged helix-turn-helix transcriptional regulator [Defluviitaleaceae bacterium]